MEDEKVLVLNVDPAKSPYVMAACAAWGAVVAGATYFMSMRFANASLHNAANIVNENFKLTEK